MATCVVTRTCRNRLAKSMYHRRERRKILLIDDDSDSSSETDLDDDIEILTRTRAEAIDLSVFELNEDSEETTSIQLARKGMLDRASSFTFELGTSYIARSIFSIHRIITVKRDVTGFWGMGDLKFTLREGEKILFSAFANKTRLQYRIIRAGDENSSSCDATIKIDRPSKEIWLADSYRDIARLLRIDDEAGIELFKRMRGVPRMLKVAEVEQNTTKLLRKPVIKSIKNIQFTDSGGNVVLASLKTEKDALTVLCIPHLPDTVVFFMSIVAFLRATGDLVRM